MALVDDVQAGIKSNKVIIGYNEAINYLKTGVKNYQKNVKALVIALEEVEEELRALRESNHVVAAMFIGTKGNIIYGIRQRYQEQIKSEEDRRMLRKKLDKFKIILFTYYFSKSSLIFFKTIPHPLSECSCDDLSAKPFWETVNFVILTSPLNSKVTKE